MKYIFRILALPFWTVIYLIASLRELLKAMLYFILYGGEAITYISKNEPKKIADIWDLLRKPGTDLYIKTGGNPFKNIKE